jgi:hypothetical protein
MTTLAQANRIGVRAGIQLGLPLDTPSSQTILPVIVGNRNGPKDTNGAPLMTNGTLLGWFSIAQTVFAGTERTFAMPEGNLPINSVTLPDLVTGSEQHRVQQYMAAVFNDLDEKVKPWLGFAGFIDTRESQYALQWFMPTEGTGYRLNKGPLLRDLTERMDVDAGGGIPSVPAPTATAGSLTWAVSLTMADMAPDCGFFDFNWVELFNAQTVGYEPLKIEIVGNPASGEFKTTVVPFPTVLPQGSVEFNTLRIIKLKPVTAGDYQFNYKITDTHGGSTNVTFTLTVA